MIFGIGTDIIRRDRIERALERWGQRFPDRLLLEVERPGYERTRDKARYLAMRFAAKEAIVKALGTGFRHGMWIRDCGTVPDSWGQPQVVFSERGAARARELGAGRGFLTLTDDAGLIVAVAVLMRADAMPLEGEA